MMLGNEHSIFSNISNLCIFSEKSALPSCKIELFMEGENVAREPFAFSVLGSCTYSPCLWVWAVALVVICMLKNGRYL